MLTNSDVTIGPVYAIPHATPDSRLVNLTPTSIVGPPEAIVLQLSDRNIRVSPCRELGVKNRISRSTNGAIVPGVRDPMVDGTSSSITGNGKENN
jgi:hypothetical protein